MQFLCGVLPFCRAKSTAMSKFSEYQGKHPAVGQNVFLAPGSHLVGDVRIGDESSIWFNCVLRGDLQPVVIGHHTNIQDGTIGHVGYKEACVIGNFVTCGHNAILHGCTVGDEVLIGMGATLMNGVVVGAQSIIGASALLTEGLEVPPGSLVYGSPAKVISHLGEKERQQLKSLAEKYCSLAAGYRHA
jgi:carbonic anhydrase/acetyltransferase-like protein (isoleucine patch superfamily)